MRKTHLKWLLLLAVALFMPWTSTAQNATHGVDGFYNYTAAQMQAEDILTVGGNGKKFPEKWYPEVSYTEDGYVKLILGANNTTLDATNGGYQHRSNVGFKQVDGKALTITKKYPVLVYKVSIPFNNEGCDASTPEKAYWEPEYLLSDGSGTGLNGLESNRKRFITTNPAIKDALGRDTVYFAKSMTSGYDHRRTANVVHTERKDTIWHCVRLDPSADEKADILIAIDFSTICAEAKEGGGVRMLDTTNIDLKALDIMSWLNVYADTLYTDESGTQQVKTKDMMPYALCKWVKTFDSMEAFDASLTAENGYGDNYAGLAAAEEPETPAAFRDIKVDLTNGAFLTAEEMPETDQPQLNFGIAIAEDGTQTRVAADDASANIVLSGKFHSTQHGWGWFSSTVKVEGPVKISMGTCAWGGDVTVKNEAGETVATFNTNTGACYSTSNPTVVSAFYKGEAATLTIAGGSYTPYIAVESVALEDIPNEIAVSFAAGSETIAGTLPAEFKAEIGKEYTLPINREMYVEGKTLTGWSDGTNTLAPGATVTAGEANVEYTPVFTANTVSIADRTEAVTINWDFQRRNGAPTVGYQGTTGIWVAQAVVNGSTIDVKCDYDVTNGKFANGNWNDWAQLNGGTKFTVPACKGAVVSLESFSATTTTTIAGDTINQGTTTPSYTYEGDAESVEVVIGDGSYFRYVQVVLPVVATKDPEVPGDSTVITPVAFRDIKIDLIGLMEESEIVDQTSVSYGVAVAEDGTVTRVATDDATANAVVSGKYWNSHGWVDITVTAKVDGPVKVGVGHCQFANHDATITDEAGNVTTFNVAGSACWEGAKTDDNVTFGYYTGEATTLTVKVPSYCPYVSIEAVSEVITEATVSFAMGEATAEGTLPVGDKVIVGNAFKIPTNFSLYAEGKTLTAWTDGTNNYAPGTEITPTADVTLTPVFTENSVKFEDRTEAVTVKWDFQRNNGAPTIGVQGAGATGFWIAQAVVNGTTIDMKMDYDATNGKIANANWGDWAQINGGTKFTVPACKGATVSIESYSATTTTTIDGQTDYTASGNVVSMTLAGTAETIDIVIGDGSYHRYIQVVYPVAEKPATGKTYENEEALIVWPFNSTATAYTATPAEAFSVISTELGDITLAGTGTGQAKDDNGNTVTFLKLQPSGSTQAAKWNIKPAAGLTFTPTHISLYIQRFGTDSENGVTVTATLADGTSVNLGNYTAPRNNKSQADDKFGASANYTNKVDVTLTAEQQATLTSSEGFTLSATVGVSSTKQGGFSDIRVSGLVNGTALEVAKYTLSTATNIEGAANINVYPNVESYEAGTEVTLTATENFGYNFVSWTDAEGNVVSELPKFVYAMEADAQLTANFVQVNTYVLNVTIDGDANDYMISYDPAPTLVNGKMMYEEGTVVGIAASSNAIVTFTNWSNGETNATQTVTMNDHVLLTATYSSVDYIVGWDFITSGGNGRPADFASTVDNETTVLYLTNGSSTVGWLDKSRDAAGGYESFVGAAVNWKPLGQYWFETKLNASEFKNIRVDAELMYNYNAYTTIDIEYSTNGTDWTKAGSVTMAGAKTENPVSATLGADANNQEVLYVRFKPDTNGAVDGTTALDNDGTTITNIFICGEKEIVDDGVAPKLLSTVPTEGATGASASGKIVLNFDEKVKLTDGAKATIGDKELEGVVSGKTITFPYMALAFNSDYTFTLSANAVSDLTDNIMSEAITINFHTIAPPTVTPGMYDRIVTTVEELLAALQDASGSTRFRIFLHDGTYDLGTACLTSVPGNVSLIGESMEGTIIVNDPQAEGIGVSATLCTGGENIYMQDLTLKSTDYDRLLTTGQSMGRCVALQENASKSVYKNVRLLSNQDTYYTRATKRTYWEGGMITGTVDYLCGGGDVFFQGVTLYNNKRGSGDCITAPATSSDWGYVFNECIIDGAEEQDGNYSLGRPWQGSPRAVYINTTMKVLPSAAGWSDMGAVPGLFAEYNSHTESGAAVDCSKRKTSFSSNGQDVAVSYNPVLTAAEAAKFTVENVLGGDDNWQPQLLTEQALAPKLAISNRVITWPASNYAFCYAICKNGKVIEFTNDNTYTIPADAADTDVFSVRVANNMGGLCAASEGVVPTDEISGVEENAAEREVISTQVYDLNGIALPALRSGINIVRTIYTDGTVETVKVIVK